MCFVCTLVLRITIGKSFKWSTTTHSRMIQIYTNKIWMKWIFKWIYCELFWWRVYGNALDIHIWAYLTYRWNHNKIVVYESMPWIYFCNVINGINHWIDSQVYSEVHLKKINWTYRRKIITTDTLLHKQQQVTCNLPRNRKQYFMTKYLRYINWMLFFGIYVLWFYLQKNSSYCTSHSI